MEIIEYYSLYNRACRRHMRHNWSWSRFGKLTLSIFEVKILCVPFLLVSLPWLFQGSQKGRYPHFQKFVSSRVFFWTSLTQSKTGIFQTRIRARNQPICVINIELLEEQNKNGTARHPHLFVVAVLCSIFLPFSTLDQDQKPEYHCCCYQTRRATTSRLFNDEIPST
jgi:hypothetical protein